MFEIGNILREARLRRGLDITECERATKIRSKYLRALEEEQFDVLPAPTYVRGFLRTYAEFLGLDGRLALDEYDSRFSTVTDVGHERETVVPRGRLPVRRVPTARPRRRSPRRTELRLLWLAIGGVLAAALVVWAGASGGTGGSAAGPIASPRLTAVFQGRGAATPTVEVRHGSARGPRVLRERLSPGHPRTLTSEGRLWVRVDRGGDLLLTVNGHAVTPPRRAATFLVGSSGLRPS